jgi:DNA-binding MarR family transcriptional regulator
MPSSVIPIISLWEEFLLRHPSGDAHDFARWVLKRKQESNSRASKRKTTATREEANSEMTAEGKVMLLIYRLHRFMEIRSKPVIKKIGFAKPHEFAMLAEIYLLQKPNKKEVANKMLLEISTAVEITKRLVQRGLIKEVSDPSDKRATRLVITEKGVKKLHESYEGLRNVHTNFLDCLDESEKKELLRLLQELEKFQSSFLTAE